MVHNPEPLIAHEEKQMLLICFPEVLCDIHDVPFGDCQNPYGWQHKGK